MFADTTNEGTALGQLSTRLRDSNLGGARLPNEDNRFTELLMFSREVVLLALQPAEPWPSAAFGSARVTACWYAISRKRFIPSLKPQGRSGASPHQNCGHSRFNSLNSCDSSNSL
jgi:hypothetical protein